MKDKSKKKLNNSSPETTNIEKHIKGKHLYHKVTLCHIHHIHIQQTQHQLVCTFVYL